MKTKEFIKREGLELFNANGLKHITLRHIAKNIGKSYGNVTYHFKTKRELIVALYNDYMKEVDHLIKEMASDEEHFFNKVLNPKLSYKLSVRYLFFYKDFVEIKRGYPKIFADIEQHNKLRMQSYLKLLNILKEKKILRQDLEDDELMYLMELSGIVRTFFFIQNDYSELIKPATAKKFADDLNRLLVPYLTGEGKRVLERPSVR